MALKVASTGPAAAAAVGGKKCTKCPVTARWHVFCCNGSPRTFNDSTAVPPHSGCCVYLFPANVQPARSEAAYLCLCPEPRWSCHQGPSACDDMCPSRTLAPAAACIIPRNQTHHSTASRASHDSKPATTHINYIELTAHREASYLCLCPEPRWSCHQGPSACDDLCPRRTLAAAAAAACIIPCNQTHHSTASKAKHDSKQQQHKTEYTS
jgi:hypothetical protein